ncbi:HMA2 domain-containing protein [Clostridium sp. LBM24168]
MYDLRINIIKIMSSLPGRIRVNIKGLLRNDEKVLKVRSKLNRYSGILSANVNKFTGNVLVYYNTDEFDEDRVLIIIKKAFNSQEVTTAENNHKSSLLKIFIDGVNPLVLFKKKYSKRVYKNEYGISGKLFKISIAVSAVVFLLTGNIANAISVFILGYPVILFALREVSYYYVSDKLNIEKIYMKDSTSLSFLESINALLIEDEVFKSKFIKNKMYDMNLNKYDIQKLVILGKLDNPVDENMKLVVNNIRMLGINNIFIIGSSENSITNYIGYLLGIEILDKNDLKKKKDPLIIDKLEDNNTVLITTDRLFESELRELCIDSIICLYRNDKLSFLKADFNLHYSDVNKLPLLIKLAYFCREVNVQTENIAITLNVFGMLLAVLNYLTPLYSVIYYILNTLLMMLTLKLRFNSYKNFNILSDTRYNCLKD